MLACGRRKKKTRGGRRALGGQTKGDGRVVKERKLSRLERWDGWVGTGGEKAGKRELACKKKCHYWQEKCRKVRKERRPKFTGKKKNRITSKKSARDFDREEKKKKINLNQKRGRKKEGMEKQTGVDQGSNWIKGRKHPSVAPV